jgi:nucleotide-binding universal stress UspA family protein
MYETIIVGVDGSRHAEDALDVSIDLAKCYGSKLIIATVYANDQFLTYGFDTPTPPPPEIQNKLDSLLKGYEEMARRKGVREVETKVISTFWKPGVGLVKEAEANGCSLIVVGNRGLSGLQRVVLGSVAEFVVLNSHCDVHIVRR